MQSFAAILLVGAEFALLISRDSWAHLSMLHLTQPFIDPGDQLSFETSFKTCSAGHQSTTSVLLQADTHRHAIKKSMADGKLSYPALSKSLLEYMYVIHLVCLLFTLSIIIYYVFSFASVLSLRPLLWWHWHLALLSLSYISLDHWSTRFFYHANFNQRV